MSEIVKEATARDVDYRSRIIQDIYADEPYDEGSVPLWKIEGHNCEQVMMTNFDASDVYMDSAIMKYGHPGDADFDQVERWLRAFHGTTVIETWHHGNYWYIAADTAAWREAMGGISPGQVRRESREGSLMAEYQAWVNGEVFRVAIERRVVEYVTVVNPPSGEIIGTRKDSTWTEIDDASVSGFYGHQQALNGAVETLDTFIAGLSS